MELEHKTDMPVTKGRQLFFPQIEYGTAVDKNLSGIGFFECSHNLQQSGLSGTAGPDDRNDFSPVDSGIYAFQNFEMPETLMYIFYLYHFSDNLRTT